MKDLVQFVVFGFMGALVLWLILVMIPQRKKISFRPSSKTHEEILKESEATEKRIRDRELQKFMDDYDSKEEFRHIHGMDDEN